MASVGAPAALTLVKKAEGFSFIRNEGTLGCRIFGADWDLRIFADDSWVVAYCDVDDPLRGGHVASIPGEPAAHALLRIFRAMAETLAPTG